MTGHSFSDLVSCFPMFSWARRRINPDDQRLSKEWHERRQLLRSTPRSEVAEENLAEWMRVDSAEWTAEKRGRSTIGIPVKLQ